MTIKRYDLFATAQGNKMQEAECQRRERVAFEAGWDGYIKAVFAWGWDTTQFKEKYFAAFQSRRDSKPEKEGE